MSDWSDPQVDNIPAADIRATASGEKVTRLREFEVRQTAEDRNDFVVEVRASVLRRARDRLGDLAHGRDFWPELLLAAATLLLGSALGAWQAGMACDAKRAPLFYVAFPVAGAVALTAYVAIRLFGGRMERATATSIMDDLPSPDEAE